MPLSAGDDTAIQRINGIQATWESYVNLPAEIGMHRSAGVGRLRITPRAVVMVAVAAQSRGGRDGRSGLDEAEAGLWEVFPGVRFSNGFLRPAASQGPIAMAAPA